MWGVIKHVGGLFSDIIKAQSQMQDEWLAHCSHWAASVVKWRVRCFRYVEETGISVCGCFSHFEAQDCKSSRREADIEGFAAASMAPLEWMALKEQS